MTRQFILLTPCLDSLISHLNADAAKIVNWCSDNMLNINGTKSHFVIFSSPLKAFTGTPSIILGPNLLHAIDHATFLGIELDSHLKFTKHISSVTRKAAYGLRILIRVRPYFNERVLISLYYAFLHSHISYCISSWGNTYQTHLAPLQHTQNQALRIITYSHFSCNALTLLRRFIIRSIGDLNKYCLCVLAYKFFQGNLPISLIST